MSALSTVVAQTSYLPLGTEEYHLLDRLEAFSGNLSTDFISTLKPISRKGAVEFLLKQDKSARFEGANFTMVDRYNIQRALSISGEWSSTPDGYNGSLPSRRPILKYFYVKQADLLQVNTDNFFLAANPILYVQGTYDRNHAGIKYINTRGAEVRGRIANRIGFYTMLGDNQEKLPSYMSAWQTQHNASPGNDYYRLTTNGVNDVFLARGYFDFNAINDHLNVTFGYDKNFIGDGLRSLFISDVGAAATFLRLRSKFWKLNYENLFLQLNQSKGRNDGIYAKKYATMHQLNINATPWLNIGVFESTVFSKANKFNVAYLVPIIFYRTIDEAIGSSNKTALGLNFKAIALKTVQVYGQGYFNSIDFSTLGKGGWKNQYGFQLGAKYFDAFTLANLDVQAEMNIVRPFTYASKDTVTKYTHYNQALAHPMEASFAEWIGSLQYRPIPKLLVAAKAIYSMRGVDSLNADNWGNDIFKPFDTAAAAASYSMFGGRKLNSLYINLNISYEIKPNIFFEVGANHLRGKYDNGINMTSSTLLYGALRWNIVRKEYDYF